MNSMWVSANLLPFFKDHLCFCFVLFCCLLMHQYTHTYFYTIRTGNGNKDGLYSVLLRDYNAHGAATCMNRLAKLRYSFNRCTLPVITSHYIRWHFLVYLIWSCSFCAIVYIGCAWGCFRYVKSSVLELTRRFALARRGVCLEVESFFGKKW